MISTDFLLCCSALQTSLELVQGLSLIVTKHNSTASKENGITEDTFSYMFQEPKTALVYKKTRRKFLYPVPDTKNPFNHFHSPHFQGLVYRQDLSCSLYVQLLKQAQEITKGTH